MPTTIYSSQHKHLVGRLKKARLAAGLNQQEAAKLLRRTQSYISKIEAGQQRIEVVQLKAFARIYKQDVSYFIS